LPWQPDKNDVTRDIASPFAYGRVRVDYPVLKEFSDAEIYEGMGDYVPSPLPNPSHLAASSSSGGSGSSSGGSGSGSGGDGDVPATAAELLPSSSSSP